MLGALVARLAMRVEYGLEVASDCLVVETLVIGCPDLLLNTLSYFIPDRLPRCCRVDLIAIQQISARLLDLFLVILRRRAQCPLTTSVATA